MAKERLLTQAGYQTLRRPVKDYFTDLKTYIFLVGGQGRPKPCTNIDKTLIYYYKNVLLVFVHQDFIENVDTVFLPVIDTILESTLWPLL